jgi:hypothetical protein
MGFIGRSMIPRGGFDPVVDRMPQDVGQRFGEGVHQPRQRVEGDEQGIGQVLIGRYSSLLP